MLWSPTSVCVYLCELAFWLHSKVNQNSDIKDNWKMCIYLRASEKFWSQKEGNSQSLALIERVVSE